MTESYVYEAFSFLSSPSDVPISLLNTNQNIFMIPEFPKLLIVQDPLVIDPLLLTPGRLFFRLAGRAWLLGGEEAGVGVEGRGDNAVVFALHFFRGGRSEKYGDNLGL